MKSWSLFAPEPTVQAEPLVEVQAAELLLRLAPGKAQPTMTSASASKNMALTCDQLMIKRRITPLPLRKKIGGLAGLWFSRDQQVADSVCLKGGVVNS